MKRLALWSAAVLGGVAIVLTVAMLVGSPPHRHTAIKLLLGAVELFTAESRSMEPAIPRGSLVVAQQWPSQWEYTRHPPDSPDLSRGSVVVFMRDRNGSLEAYLKRIVAFPRDRVRVEADGFVLVGIDGDMTNLIVYCEGTGWNIEPYDMILESPDICVLGDNCASSIDSCQFRHDPVSGLDITDLALYAFVDPFDDRALYVNPDWNWTTY